MTHQAPGQMLGYLYQVRYALYLLLISENEQANISIEKFDDIAFDNSDTPEMMIQLKHHVKTYGDLNNASTDLWRTFKVWIDSINIESTLLETTKFIIITTAGAPEYSAAFYLKPESEFRNTSKAYDILCDVAESSVNKSHSNFYNAFISLSEEKRRLLLDCIYVIDNSSNIVDVETDIYKTIRYSCLPQFSKQVLERLEGWWFKTAIGALLSDNAVFVSQGQVHSKIVSIGQEYTPDNLPIDIDEIETQDIENMDESNSVFYNQLKLICLSNQRMSMAVRDYYRAFKQRSNWVRNNLLYIDELQDYERKLVEEWEHEFSVMQDELSDYGDDISEDIKNKAGKKLLKDMEDKDIRIRERCSEAFVMRGSYHILSNQLKVGWHIDFLNRLKDLLKA